MSLEVRGEDFAMGVRMRSKMLVKRGTQLGMVQHRTETDVEDLTAVVTVQVCCFQVTVVRYAVGIWSRCQLRGNVVGSTVGIESRS